MKTVFIIGGGIAGIEAAVNLAKLGHQPIILEKEKEIGGHLLHWDRLFPDQKLASDVLSTLIKQIPENTNIITGQRIQHLEQKDEQFEIILNNNQCYKADALLFANGFELFPAQRKEEYGYTIYDNVITSKDLEHMFSEHKVVCKNGEAPQRVAFIHCVGSRDEKVNHRYCSKLCCATAVKQACEIKELYPETEVYNLYMDLRMYDRHFENMYHSAQTEYGINFIRGRLSEAFEDPNGKITIKAEDTLIGKPIKLQVDMLVLMAGMQAIDIEKKRIEKVHLETESDGFFSPIDPYTNNNKTKTSGMFYAGCCTGPKNVPETLADARAAALQIHQYLI